MRILSVLFLAFVALSLLVSGQAEFPGDTPPAGYNETCEAEPILYDYFGPFCLHPVYWNIPGYYPIGSAIAFINPETNLPDVGRVTSYYWDRQFDIYVYQALYLPSADPLQRRYVLVMPSALIPFS